MSDAVDWIARSGAKAKGKRPAYFDDPGIDRVLSIVMALAGEVSVLRERLDTVERLLNTETGVTRAMIEGYVPDRDAAAARGMMTKEFIARIMRGLQQDMEALAENAPSVEDVSRQLRDM